MYGNNFETSVIEYCKNIRISHFLLTLLVAQTPLELYLSSNHIGGMVHLQSCQHKIDSVL